MTTTVLKYAAFAASPEGGNPAGVVLDADHLSAVEMQQIARDVGYSETAFVTEKRGDRLSARYFSPAAEVPFCGHATVATAIAMAAHYGHATMVFDTQVGDVSLHVSTNEAGISIAEFTSVEPSNRAMSQHTLDRLLGLLSLNSADLDPRFPPREAFAGNWHPVLVLSDRELFHQFRYQPAEVAALMREQGWAGTVTVLHAIAADEFLARNLFPVGRISEDPATGSAAASVGGYLRELNAVPAGRTVQIHQGAHVGRPSLLTVVIPETGGINVLGTAQPIA